MSVEGGEIFEGGEKRPEYVRLVEGEKIAEKVGLAGCEKVVWCETGYYLPERPSFTYDPLFHAGCYYVQEAASMFLEQVVKQYITSPVVCLDLCAAPGGKSTHLQSLLPAKSLLVSNEVIQSRASVLKENMIKWGSPYTVVTCNDPKDFSLLTQMFDVIVADLPCSGEGMFRKDGRSRDEWSPDNVKLCAARQRRIIRDIWPSLKPGGLLVYSTCTFNREENEENIRHLIDDYNAEVLSIAIEESWGVSPAIDESFPMYRFFPHRTKGEGFCLALVRKPGEENMIQGFKDSKSQEFCPRISQLDTKKESKYQRTDVQYSTLKPSPSKVKRHNPLHLHHGLGKNDFFDNASCCNDWLVVSDDGYHFEVSRKMVRAIPESVLGIYRLITKHLHVLYAGVTVGEIKGNDIVPSPALALSTSFRREAFSSIELSKELCIRYLQNEALILPESVPIGFVVVTYQHVPLGFVKNIGTRANNLYPQAWRIRGRLPQSSSM
ncbi:MAG: RsmB/NOP family class I SAM-dependent RNA methyltransferase [Tannerella sp.]|nr:RsmB/NOP family class I SAM-dependent RNA methyltransferase [Tannerella sp.]